MKASSLVWAALGLELALLLLVLVGPTPPTWLPGETLPGPAMFLRAALAALAIPAAGLPFALWLVGRGGGDRQPPRPGLFTLLALGLGCGLVLFYLAAVVIRLFAPLTATALALVALGSGAVGLVLPPRLHRARIGLERGLSAWPLLLGLAAMLLFGAFSAVHLFAGPRRMVQITPALRDRLADVVPLRGELRFLSGVKRVHGIRRYVVRGPEARFTVEVDGQADLDLPFIYRAPPGSRAELWQLPGQQCQLDVDGPAPRLLARAAVPEEVLGFRVAPVLPRSNVVLVARAKAPSGRGCFALRFDSRPGPPDELVDLTGLHLDRPTLFNDWIVFARDTEIECHVADLSYHLELRHSNRINPFLLLWGCFTQTVAEVLAGASYPLLGLQFLLLAFMAFMAALAAMGAVAPDAPPERLRLCGLLLVAPLLLHVNAVTMAHVESFPFPDTPFSTLLMGALALLLLRHRVGFILLGCLAAYARYPGGYVLAVALVAYLALFGQDRPWGKRTLLWALAAGLAVVALLALHYASTVGLGNAVKAVYFEIFPEHFKVHAHPAPLWQRWATFFAKLAVLSAGAVALWPLVRRSPAGRLLIVVTLGYALPLMGVHEPHAHYFPVLIYTTAAAGLGGLARTPRFPAWAGVLIVAAGTAVGLHLDSWLGIPL